MLKLYLCTMNKILSPKKLLLVLGFILSMQGFASFVDNGSTKKTNANTDISLKNFNKSNYKNTAYPSFRLSSFQYKGSSSRYQVNSRNSIEGQSVIRLENGNTAYVYPYRYKVKAPLFKTPIAPATH